MKQKIRVGILFGGQSAEHEVSIVTARNVYEALDKEKYEAVLVGIDKKGSWHLTSPDQLRLASQSVAKAVLPVFTESIQVMPYSQEKSLISTNPEEKIGKIDVVFPLLHGPYGEDGTVQGFLKLIGVPFVGADVLGSAVGMDKDIMKRLLRDAGIPIVTFLTFYQHEKEKIVFEQVARQLGLPCFVKPANMGSSIGVSKVTSKYEFKKAITKAFEYDKKLLIERGVDAREVECSVLGNEEKRASVLGEVIPTHEFYDYESKYIDVEGARLEIPAELTEQQVKEIQKLAVKTCEILEIEGMARVDFFVEKKTQNVYVNEVNTIPGFTNISMYPKLWEASGISYADLIDKLLQLAIARKANK